MNDPAPGGEPLRVVATAGHVDHGKSSLIVRLTGIDPDRWAEEKRRGLTIDLGFAWTTLPSGREIGFVDVPGHERFVRNMLAGVGPVRLVLFVVAADEGWKPQSEEHLEIVDVLGAEGGVVALTKSDLVAGDELDARERELRERLAGSALGEARIVRCSSATGAGLDEVREALDEMIDAAPTPADEGRPRLAIDRAFTIRGAGTVVTGTLTGGSLHVGDVVRIYPRGGSVRIRSLETHRRPTSRARPVSRVAANLAGTSKDEVRRGDVLAAPGAWRPTAVLEARIRGVRSLRHGLGARGAYKLYIGSAERDARLRLFGDAEVRAGDSAFARIRLVEPVVAEPGDRFVVREAGRRETVAGGVVLDAHPPAAPGPDAERRLARRASAPPGALASIAVDERGAVRASELAVIATGASAPIEGAERVGDWWVSRGTLEELAGLARAILASHHAEHPLRQGMEAAELRRLLVERADPRLARAFEQGLAADVTAALEAAGVLVREGTLVRAAEHRVTIDEREARRLVDAVASAEPSPPTVRDLVAAGHARELIDACVSAGLLVRVSEDLVVTPELAGRAETLALSEAASAGGVTVSRFRELLGTTRKYALPLLEWLDARGVTRRDGDVRRPA